MKWYSFVSCLLAAGSLVVFPELSLAHGGGGFGGGGGGGHGFGGGGFGGHGFSRSFAGVSGRGFGSAVRGTRGFADRGVFGRDEIAISAIAGFVILIEAFSILASLALATHTMTRITIHMITRITIHMMTCLTIHIRTTATTLI
jgi:hypothetical protein